jgi:hypothetical protein
VNPVDQLSNSIKSVASARLRAAGVPMPRVAPIPASRTLPEGFAFPVIAREDRRHGGPMHLCQNEQELASVPWHALLEPVVVEYRDVQSPDGWFRKWRYLVAGESGAPRHLVPARWVVRPSGASGRTAMARARCLREDHRSSWSGGEALGLGVVA